jgi:hypothetical protein
MPERRQRVPHGTNRMWRTNNFFSSVSPTWVVNGARPSVLQSERAGRPGKQSCRSRTRPLTPAATPTHTEIGGELRLTRDGGATWTDLDPGRNAPRAAGQRAPPSSRQIQRSCTSGSRASTTARPGKNQGMCFKTTIATSCGRRHGTTSARRLTSPFNVIAIDPRNPRLLLLCGHRHRLVAQHGGRGTWIKDGLDVGLLPHPSYDIRINPRPT